MPVDQSLVGRQFPPTRPHVVTEDGLREFAAATGGEYAGQAPATYPIVLAFEAMNAFLEGEGVEQISEAIRALTLDCERVADDMLISARLREW